MSLHNQIGDAVPEDYLGAREITSFGGRLANDNVAGGALPRRRRFAASWGLPAAAFVSGLSAAIVLSGIGDLLGIG